MLEKIHIFHTNDLHSHFEYWPRMQSYIKEQRVLLAQKGEPSFLLDIGDHMDRSNIYTDATLGKGNVQMLNDAQYDAVTIGNNEGITLSFEDLYHLYEDAKFDVVVANLSAMNTENPEWLKRSTIFTTKYGTKIGVIGATAQFDAFYETLNWTVCEPRIEIIKEVERLKEQVDIIVCMSHLGINDDELLANECPDLHVIFGAHTHHEFPEGKWINGVLLTGGGKFGRFTGHLQIDYNHEKKRIDCLQERLIENEQLVQADGEEDFLHELATTGKHLLSEPVAHIHRTYTKEWFHDSPIARLFAEALLSYTSADCAMFNAGIFVEDLHKGYVTSYDMHRILPHPINPCIIELTGAELKEMYKQAQNEEWPNKRINGLGFRGVVFGKMLFYQLKIDEHYELFINDKPVIHDNIYRLATLDMFTFGYFFPNFKYAKKQYVLPTFLRDVFLHYIKNLAR